MNSTTTNLIGKRAILYSRVSTGDQVDGYSLTNQDEQMKNFCRKNQIEIIKMFREEGASAKTFNRPEFQKAQKLIEKSKNKVDFFLVYSWDRFSRNMFEAFATIKKFENLGVEVNSITQWLDHSDPNQLFLFSIHLATPEVENRNRSNKCRTGMIQAKKEGRWVHQAPFGYKMINKYLEPSEESKMVTEAFQRVYDGSFFSLQDLRSELNRKHGQKLSKAAFCSMLRKKVYCGLIEINATGNQPKEVIQGVHQPLVSPTTFQRVQEKLSKTPSRQFGKHDHNQDFVLRGFLWCQNCNRFLTASYSRSRNGNKHGYYHCDSSPGCERYRTDALNKKFEENLKDYTFPKNILNLYRAILHHIFSDTRESSQETTVKLEREKNAVDEKLLKLEVRFTEGEIEPDTFSRVKSLYQKEISTLSERIEALNSSKTDYQNHLDYGINLLSDLLGIYRKQGVQGKRTIIGSMFGEKIVLDGLKPRTQDTNNVLLYLSSICKGEKSIAHEKTDDFRPSVLIGAPLSLHLEHLEKILALRHTISLT